MGTLVSVLANDGFVCGRVLSDIRRRMLSRVRGVIGVGAGANTYFGEYLKLILTQKGELSTENDNKLLTLAWFSLATQAQRRRQAQ